RRHPRIQEQYKEIGGKSPLVELTENQRALLEAKLNEKGLNAKVYTAMRYWHPFTESAIEKIERDNIKRVVLLPLYPQFSKSTTGSSIKEWQRQTAEKSLDIQTEIVEKYHVYPPYLDAVIQRIEQTLEKFPAEKRGEVQILFSAHGTPMKLVREGDPYSFQIAETVEAVMKRSGSSKTSSLFQSKVGPQKWLTPSTLDVIEKLAAGGAKQMLIVPIAFVSDHLETLFEIGLEFRHLAREKGVEQFEVTEGLNDSDLFAEALASLVIEKIEPKVQTAKV
ncbi:MAG: ferrochelatase, partial [Blastocatellia bacterium]|nr:ferrochelatase [Blastocatellia bacterium]